MESRRRDLKGTQEKSRMTLYQIELTSLLEQRLTREADQRGVPVETLTFTLLDEHLPTPDRQTELISLLRSWAEDGDPEEQRETGEYLIRSLDEDRLSDRKLFPSELQGVTW